MLTYNITTHTLSSSVAEKLKSLFLLFAGHIIKNATSVLDSNHEEKQGLLFITASSETTFARPLNAPVSPSPQSYLSSRRKTVRWRRRRAISCWATSCPVWAGASSMIGAPSSPRSGLTRCCTLWWTRYPVDQLYSHTK